MWIMTQQMNRIINSDQIVDIFIGRTGCSIFAEITKDKDCICLGEYKFKERCARVFNCLALIIGGDTIMQTITIPENDDEDIERFCDVTTDLLAASVIHSLKQRP